jgi:hypothetical protein
MGKKLSTFIGDSMYTRAPPTHRSPLRSNHPKNQTVFPVMPTHQHLTWNRANITTQWDAETIHNTVMVVIHPINFSIFHKKVYTCMNQHFAALQDKSNSYHEIWQKWLWRGLKHSSTFTEVCNTSHATIGLRMDSANDVYIIVWQSGPQGTEDQKLYFKRGALPFIFRVSFCSAIVVCFTLFITAVDHGTQYIFDIISLNRILSTNVFLTVLKQKNCTKEVLYYGKFDIHNDTWWNKHIIN